MYTISTPCGKAVTEKKFRGDWIQHFLRINDENF